MTAIAPDDDPAAIRALIAALQPRHVVAIHTDAAHAFATLTTTEATPVADHDWWNVSAASSAPGTPDTTPQALEPTTNRRTRC